MTVKDMLSHTTEEQFTVLMYDGEKLCFGKSKHLMAVLSEETLGMEVIFFTPDGTTLTVKLAQPVNPKTE